jgi:hypothetical protein
MNIVLGSGLFREIAVPYDILSKRTDSTDIMAQSRLDVVNYIISMVPMGFGIHLLGMTTLEELELHNRGWVKSIDTGYPVMCGQVGLRFGIDKLPGTNPLSNGGTGKRPWES